MTYTVETEINQPRQKVVELFDNPDNLAYWQQGFVSYTLESGESGQPGSKARLKFKRETGEEFDMLETIISRDLPDEFTGEFDVPKMFTMTVKYEFRELGPEKTRVSSVNDMKCKGIMMKLMSPFIKSCSKRESQKYLNNFKAFAETGADIRKPAG